MRGAAATTLARTGDGAALRPLLEAFKRWPQPATARALGVLGEKRAASTLRRALRDAEPAHTDYVVALLEALTRLGGRDDAEAILPWTSHPDAALRRAAVVAAGAIGGERLSVRVDERRHDFALAVRRAARAATKASASNATRAGAQ